MNTIKGSPCGTSRKTAIIVGVLYIIGTVAGVLSLVFAGSILNDPDYLIKVSANQNQIVIGALFVLTMGLALAMVSSDDVSDPEKASMKPWLLGMLFSGERLRPLAILQWRSVGYSYIVVSQEYVKAGAADASYFQTLGALVLASQRSD